MAWKVQDSSGRAKGAISAYGWNILSATGSGLVVVDHGSMSGLADDDHPQYLLVANIDDVAVNGETAQPISSNWAFDHVAAADPHTGYRLESADHNHQTTGAEAGQLDHGLALNGLTDDDHTQYALLAGRSGGQTLKGGTGAAETLLLQGTDHATVGNIVINTAAIAPNATNGFLYVPSCAGTPTGVPTTFAGRVPIVVDTTNNKLYFYSGGAWRDAGP